MKKLISLLLILTLTALCVGCGGAGRSCAILTPESHSEKCEESAYELQDR